MNPATGRAILDPCPLSHTSFRCVAVLKLRGKAIAYHSQFINEFCEDYGVPKKINRAPRIEAPSIALLSVRPSP